MGLTRRTYRQRVLDEYGAEPPPWLSENWVNTQIDRASREVAEATGFKQGTAGFTAAKNTRLYTLAPDFIRVDAVEANASRGLDPTTKEEVQYLYGDSWRAGTGALSKWYMEDKRRIGLYPIPATAGSALLIFGPQYPAVLSSDTQTSEVPTGLEDAVISRICHRMARRDNRPEMRQLAEQFLAEFDGAVNRFRSVEPMAAGTKFVGPPRA